MSSKTISFADIMKEEENKKKNAKKQEKKQFNYEDYMGDMDPDMLLALQLQDEFNQESEYLNNSTNEYVYEDNNNNSTNEYIYEDNNNISTNSIDENLTSHIKSLETKSLSDLSQQMNEQNNISSIIMNSPINQVDYDADMALALKLSLEEEENYANYQYNQNKSNAKLQIKSVNDYYIPYDDISYDKDEDEPLEVDDDNVWQQRENELLKTKEGHYVTKHDPDMLAEQNTQYIDESIHLYPQAGDLSQYIVKSEATRFLINHQKRQQRKGIEMHKAVEKQEYQTEDLVFDKNTSLEIYKMINNGIIEGIHSFIQAGKESSVYSCIQIEDDKEILVCMKIHATNQNIFTHRHEYLEGDYRYNSYNLTKSNTKNFINLWAQKEFSNLTNVYKHNIACPVPLYHKNNIIIMSFIGDNETPAPRISDIISSVPAIDDIIQQSIFILKNMYCKCHLIHGDFSLYNLLYHNSTVYIIDVGQSVDILHPEAETFLKRDLTTFINSIKKYKDITSYFDELLLFIKNEDEHTNEENIQIFKNIFEH